MIWEIFTANCSLSFAEKVFSFLSQDEVEKLKQEEERKMATLGRRRYQERAYEPEDDYGSGDEEQEIRERYAKADENDNDMRWLSPFHPFCLCPLKLRVCVFSLSTLFVTFLSTVSRCADLLFVFVWRASVRVNASLFPLILSLQF